jgi:hypothetical protein
VAPTKQASTGAARIQSFTVQMPESALEDLHHRIDETRWPHPELVNDRSQRRALRHHAKGWDPGRTAKAWAELMHRLGYTRYVARGGAGKSRNCSRTRCATRSVPTDEPDMSTKD